MVRLTENYMDEKKRDALLLALAEAVLMLMMKQGAAGSTDEAERLTIAIREARTP